MPTNWETLLGVLASAPAFPLAMPIYSFAWWAYTWTLIPILTHVSESTNRSIRSVHGAPQLVAVSGRCLVTPHCVIVHTPSEPPALPVSASAAGRHPATSAINQSAPSIVRALWHIARLSILTSMRRARHIGGWRGGVVRVEDQWIRTFHWTFLSSEVDLFLLDTCPRESLSYLLATIT